MASPSVLLLGVQFANAAYILHHVAAMTGAAVAREGFGVENVNVVSRISTQVAGSRFDVVSPHSPLWRPAVAIKELLPRVQGVIMVYSIAAITLREAKEHSGHAIEEAAGRRVPVAFVLNDHWSPSGRSMEVIDARELPVPLGSELLTTCICVNPSCKRREADAGALMALAAGMLSRTPMA